MRIPVSLPPVWIVLADHMKNVATLHRFVLNSNNFLMKMVLNVMLNKIIMKTKKNLKDCGFCEGKFLTV